MATTALAPTQQSEPLSIYIRRPDVVEKFSLVLGNDREALTFVQSVILLVQNSDPGEYSLQNCSYESIVRSALRAATLRVSVDPALRQSWLVPRWNSKTKKLEANLQFHYAEVRNRAMRSGRYWFINVSPVYQDETVLENIYTGMHQVQLASGLLTSPTQQDGFVPVRTRLGSVQGWLGYYKMVRGQEATVYMSIDDIERFMDNSPVAKYWKTSKAWKDNRETMEKKTVLLALLRKADISAPGMEEVKKVLTEVETVEAVEADVFDSDSGVEVIDGTDEEAIKDVPKDIIDFPPVTPTPPAPPAEPVKVEEKHADRPYPPLVLKQKYEEAVAVIVKKAENKAIDVGSREKQVVAAILTTTLNGDKLAKGEVCAFLSGEQSLGLMTPAQVRAFVYVLGIKITGEKGDFDQAPSEMAIKEIRAAHEFYKATLTDPNAK